MSPRFWEEWYVLSFDNDGPSESQVLEWEESLGLESGSILTRNRMTFLYMGFPNLHEAPISEMDEHLTQGDPRRDPHILSLENLFVSSGGQELLYLPHIIPLSRYKNVLDSWLTDGQAEFLDDDVGIRRVLVIVSLFISLILTVPKKGTRFLLIPAALPWLVLIFGLGGIALPVAALGLLSAALHSWSGRSQGIWRQSLPWLGTVITGSLATFLTLETKNPFLVVIFTLLALGSHVVFNRISSFGYFSSLSTAKRRKQTDHVLFEPIPMKSASLRSFSPSMSWRNEGLWCIGFALAFAVLSFASLNLERTDVDGIPALGEVQGAWSSPSAYWDLFNRRDAQSLPDASTLLASRYYQEGLPFGAEYRVPMPGEALIFAEFSRDGDRLIRNERDVVVFSPSWIADFLARSHNTFFGALFFDSEGPAPILRLDEAPQKYPHWTSRHAFFGAMISLVIAIGVFLFGLRIHEPRERTIPSRIPLRRRPKAA